MQVKYGRLWVLSRNSSKFMPDVATLAKIIQELTRKGAVLKLKHLIIQAQTLAYCRCISSWFRGGSHPAAGIDMESCLLCFVELN